MQNGIRFHAYEQNSILTATAAMTTSASPAAARLYRVALLAALIALPFTFFYNRELFFILNCRTDQKTLNLVFLTLTSLADGLWMMMLAAIVQSVAPRNFKAFLIALVLGNIFLQAGKYFVDADRPLLALGENAICLLGQKLTARSFPSGHAFSAMLFFMYVRPRRSVAAALLLVLTGAAAFSRAYVGVHFPRDIMTGILIAVVAFLLAEKLATRITFRETSLRLRKALVAFLGIGTAIIYIFAYHEKTRELEFLLTPAAWAVVIYWVLYAIRLFVRRPVSS